MSNKKYHRHRICSLCQKDFVNGQVFPAELIRPGVAELIHQAYPDWSQEGYICANDLSRFRHEYIKGLIRQDKGELTNLDEEVVNSLREHDILAENINLKFSKDLTFGERMADRVARFGGSWTFILSFLSIILIWMFINSYILIHRPFDPFPYILLNLVLSCLAAIQAPIIMMSQNRQAEKDRLQADDDYQTNLKSELEVRQLHLKMDQFMKKQWERLFEIQQVQLDIMEDLLHKQVKSDGPPKSNGK